MRSGLSHLHAAASGAFAELRGIFRGCKNARHQRDSFASADAHFEEVPGAIGRDAAGEQREARLGVGSPAGRSRREPRESRRSPDFKRRRRSWLAGRRRRSCGGRSSGGSDHSRGGVRTHWMAACRTFERDMPWAPPESRASPTPLGRLLRSRCECSKRDVFHFKPGQPRHGADKDRGAHVLHSNVRDHNPLQPSAVDYLHCDSGDEIRHPRRSVELRDLQRAGGSQGPRRGDDDVVAAGGIDGRRCWDRSPGS